MCSYITLENRIGLTKFCWREWARVVSATPRPDHESNSNPYKNEIEGKLVHLYFCKSNPELNIDKIKHLSSDSERYTLIGNVFYLYAPDGIGRSKLVANIEAYLGVAATARNLNTVNKVCIFFNRI